MVKRRRILVVESSDSEEEMRNLADNRKKRRCELIKKLTKTDTTTCPDCFVRITHLPRHMNLVHGVPKHIARYTRLQYNMRKSTKRLRNPKFVDYHVKKKCPVPNCAAIVKRMSRHLQTVHLMSLEDQIKTFGSNCGTPVDTTKKSQNEARRKKHSSKETANCELSLRTAMTPNNISTRNGGIKLVRSLKKSAVLGKKINDIKTQKKDNKKSCQPLNIKKTKQYCDSDDMFANSSEDEKPMLQSRRKSTRTPKPVTVIDHMDSSTETLEDSDNDKDYCPESSEDTENDDISPETRDAVYNKETETLEDAVYNKETETLEDAVYNKETETLEDAVYNKETETLEDAVYNKETETLEDAVYNKETESLEDAVYNKETETLEDAVYNKETETLEDAVYNKETETLEDAVYNKETETLEDAVYNKETETLEDAVYNKETETLEDAVYNQETETLEDAVYNKENETLEDTANTSSKELDEFLYDSDESLNNFTDEYKPWAWLKAKIKLWMQLKSLEESTITDMLKRIEFLFKENRSQDYRRLLNINKAGALINNIKKQNNNDPSSTQTKIKYVCALKHLARFFLANPKVDSFCNSSRMQTYIQTLTDFSCSKRKAVMRELWKKNETDSKLIPKEEDIGAYLSCDLRASVKKRILDCSINEPSQMILTDYMQILGYLFMEISFENANRAGEARNLTVKELINATTLPDNSMVVHVKDHKTNTTYGASPVIISPDLSKEIQIYKEKIRQTNPIKPCDYLFTSSVGSKVSSGNMPRIMQQYWDSTGFPGKVGASLLRKASVTYIRRNAPTLASKLALKMQHSLKTQSKFYYVEDKMKNAVEVSSQLRKLHSTQQKKISSGKSSDFPKVINSQEITTTSTQSSNSAGDCDLSDQNSEQAIETLAENSSKAEVGINDEAQSVIAMPLSEGESSQPFMQMRALAEERKFLLKNESETRGEKSHDLNQFTMPEECVLYEAFAGLIQKRETYPLNASAITKNLSKTEAGKDILKRFDTKKIHNKIKYYKKRQPLGKNSEIIARLTT